MIKHKNLTWWERFKQLRRFCKEFKKVEIVEVRVVTSLDPQEVYGFFGYRESIQYDHTHPVFGVLVRNKRFDQWSECARIPLLRRFLKADFAQIRMELLIALEQKVLFHNAKPWNIIAKKHRKLLDATLKWTERKGRLYDNRFTN